MNKIEEYKKAKAGLDILDDIPRYAAEGWEKISDGDKERLKWAGIFFRRQTPGRFMMRLRFANGLMNAPQLRTIGEISRDFGKGFADITTRQQMQLREFTIDDVPEIWRRLHAVDLISLQTGMDNIRGVIGCPVAGLTPNELFDASPVARQFTGLFIGNRAFTDLPRKFNVTITTHMLFGMPFASSVGLLGSPVKPMIIPFEINHNDQAITLENDLKAKGVRTPQALKPIVDEAKKAGKPMTFAMTFPPGTHAMWTRYWLAAGGINPDKDVTLITIPPAQMVANMRTTDHDC